jgi:NADPH:quinone reductase-like Zn-dependent oxidoreductase
MKAIVQRSYGSPDRLRLEDVPKPTAVDGGVLVQVRAASVNSGDWRRVRASPAIVRLVEGVRRPKQPLLGVDVAGVVEAVGKGHTRLHVGADVYGMRAGAFAEYVSGKSFVLKPANLTFEQAAAVPATACTALQALRDQGHVQPGQTVLINGAGGGVGTFAVQIAKAFGAEVTAVTSTDKLELARSIGADHVVDYTHEDLSRRAERYDLIVDASGRPSIAAFRRALAPGGTIVLVAAGHGRFGALARIAGAKLRRRVLKQPVVFFISSGPFEENLETLKEFIEAGKVTPVIERTYTLSETPQAVGYAETEHARGKLVISVSGADEPAG